MPITTLFFDLDETLYPPSSGLWEAISTRIEQFMHLQVGLPLDEIPALRNQYYQQYGTTLRGLVFNHQINEHDYLAYVHDIPLQNYLSPAPHLHELLLRYPQRRVIFTNADRAHADRVLKILGLADCFERIIDVLDTWPACKPLPAAYQTALRLAGSTPTESVLLDDSLKNLAAAHAMGFTTIRCWGSPAPSCDASILDLADLPSVLAPDRTAPFLGTEWTLP